MTTTDKDFRVKNGLLVGGDGTFDGTVNSDALQLDTSLNLIPAVGQISWNQDLETLNVGLDENVTLQVGQEHLVRVKNNSGDTAIPNFTFVMFAGANGDTVKVSPATTDGAVPYEYMVGITTEEIPADGFGFVTQFGFVDKVDTSSYTVGTLLYPDPATPGSFVSSQPSAPAFNTAIAAVTRSHATTGRVLVRMTNGVTVDNIHDVQITNPSDGQVLMYDTVNHIWVNGDAAGGSSLTVSDSTPENPEVGDQWYNSGDGVTYVYYDSYWVEASSGGQAADLAGYATEQYVDDAIAAIPAVDLTGYATETYVETAVAGLVDSAPTTLNTLNELAAALGDDENFATTVTTELAGKANLADLSPVGVINMWAAASAPTNWLVCDGAAVSRSTYSSLFSVLGTTYGSGDGSTTFNIPNLKGRVPVGFDAAQTEFDTLGENGGAKTHTLTTAEMPSHTHIQNSHYHSYTYTTMGYMWGVGGTEGGYFPQTTSNQTGSTTAVNQNTGGDEAHNNLQPYITLNYIIKAA